MTILKSWMHGTSASREIWYSVIYSHLQSLCNINGVVYLTYIWNQKSYSWVHRIWYLPYGSNLHSRVLNTWNIRFTPNLRTEQIFCKCNHFSYRSEDQISAIYIKSEYYRLRHMEPPIGTNFRLLSMCYVWLYESQNWGDCEVIGQNFAIFNIFELF